MPSTQYSPMDEKIPGLPNYDPVPSGSSGGPSSGSQLPPITAPPQRPEADTRQPTAPQISPNKRGGTVGAVAFLGDSILRGFQRGREQAEQQKAYKTNRLIQGMQFAYQNAAKHYTDLIKNGADPKSKEVMDAAAAADAAWASMMQIYGNYINPQDGKKGKGGKSKSGQGGQGNPETNPVQQIQSQDPKEKLQGWYAITAKAGPPYKYEAQQYMTPEYQQQIKNRQSEQQLTGDILGKRTRLHELQRIDPTQLKPEQKSELERLQADPELFPEMGKRPQKETEYIGDDGKKHIRYRRPDGSTYEETSDEKVRPPASLIAKPGSEQEYIERVAKEAGIAEKDLSAESLQQLRSSWVSSGQMGKIVDQNYVYTDKETGEIHVVKLQRSTTPQRVGTPEVHASGEPKTTGDSTGVPSATPHHTATPSGAGAGAGTGSDRVIGHTMSQPHAKSAAVTTDTYKKMKPLFGLLAAQEDYMKEVDSNPSKASPRQDLSLVVAAVRAMNPGSVRLPQKELELEMKAGSYGDQARRWWEKASTGLLPDDQRKDLFHIVQRETTKAGESLAADWQQNMSGQPLPSDIKRFAKTPTAAGTGSGDSSGSAGPKLTPEQQKSLDAAFPK